MPKRVYCLYRVSTKQQVEKDDIPMQRQYCHEFVESKDDWEIVKEFSEKGVSGFKISAKDRDVVQEIQKDATLGKFDILLVFMFDRLGRKEDETPFVVEWFVNNGIEVWSAQEGQQRFDTHVDKLMNYIRYWQASGESVKTSIRTKTRLGQIVQEGRFRGGCAPYGYKLVKNGRKGKKNRELYDIVIEPEEALTIQKIFNFAEHYGYGGRRISSVLGEASIINIRTGEPFHYSTIQNILKNVLYTGILRSGETRSDIIPELQIITPEQFARVQKGREQRSAEYEEKCAAAQTVELANGEEIEVSRPERMCPKRNVGKAMLSGNIYCGHCGGRIFASTARKNHHPTKGEIKERISVYKCYNRTQHKERCEGPSTYRAEKGDQVVDSILSGIFLRAKSVKESDLIERQVHSSTTAYQKQLKTAKAEYTKSSKELSKWENLMLDSIEGNCAFTPEQVKKRMDAVQQSVDNLTMQIQDLQTKITETNLMTDKIKEERQKLLSWAELYDGTSVEEKKMIASYLIKAVTVSRDYGIQIDFNISEAEYLNGMAMA